MWPCQIFRSYRTASCSAAPRPSSRSSAHPLNPLRVLWRPNLLCLLFPPQKTMSQDSIYCFSKSYVSSSLPPPDAASDKDAPDPLSRAHRARRRRSRRHARGLPQLPPQLQRLPIGPATAAPPGRHTILTSDYDEVNVLLHILCEHTRCAQIRR